MPADANPLGVLDGQWVLRPAGRSAFPGRGCDHGGRRRDRCGYDLFGPRPPRDGPFLKYSRKIPVSMVRALPTMT